MTDTNKIENVEIVLLPTGMRKGLWDYANQQIHEAEVAKNRAEAEAKRHLNNIDYWKRIALACEHGVCKPCNGLGKFREWLAQDESRLVDCSACRGTGVKNDPADLIAKIGMLGR